ncbi:hypothetical protein LVJ94_12310 [Pendulispora rubella]|uniref:Uncharacterized protein n=1 Tax=Pendulispora rubella TaxID=2741070 RepID=A0ABZ2LDZ7_9BACT
MKNFTRETFWSTRNFKVSSKTPAVCPSMPNIIKAMTWMPFGLECRQVLRVDRGSRCSDRCPDAAFPRWCGHHFWGVRAFSHANELARSVHARTAACREIVQGTGKHGFGLTHDDGVRVIGGPMAPMATTSAG